MSEDHYELHQTSLTETEGEPRWSQLLKRSQNIPSPSWTCCQKTPVVQRNLPPAPAPANNNHEKDDVPGYTSSRRTLDQKQQQSSRPPTVLDTTVEKHDLPVSALSIDFQLTKAQLPARCPYCKRRKEYRSIRKFVRHLESCPQAPKEVRERVTNIEANICVFCRKRQRVITCHEEIDHYAYGCGAVATSNRHKQCLPRRKIDPVRHFLAGKVKLTADDTFNYILRHLVLPIVKELERSDDKELVSKLREALKRYRATAMPCSEPKGDCTTSAGHAADGGVPIEDLTESDHRLHDRTRDKTTSADDEPDDKASWLARGTLTGHSLYNQFRLLICRA